MKSKDQQLLEEAYNNTKRVVDNTKVTIAVNSSVAVPTDTGIEIATVVAIDTNKQLIKVKSNQGKQVVVKARDVIVIDPAGDQDDQELRAMDMLADCNTYKL